MRSTSADCGSVVPARQAIAGSGALTQLALRRDRITLSGWVLVLAGLMAMFTRFAMAMLPTQEDALADARMLAGAPGMRILGVPSGPTVGSSALVRGWLAIAVLAALMSTLTVVRHTRQNEEMDRAELVGAAVVGRHASLVAAVVVGVAANVALSLLSAAALIVNGQPVGGSIVAGVSLGAVGLVFVGVAAVTTQLAASARGANGIAAAILGVAFLLAGVGNVRGTVDSSGLKVVPAWPAWLSPIGWSQQMRPYGGDHAWQLGLHAGLFVALLAASAVLVTRRDLGRGVLPARTGRATASPGLLRPYGLVARLQRGALIGWVVGMLGFGLILGGTVAQVTNVEGAATEWRLFRTPLIALAGMGAAVFVVQALLRMRSGEAGGQLESVLATAVSRPRLAGTYVLHALLSTIGLLLVYTVSMGLTAGAALGEVAGQLRVTLEAGLVQLPAIAVIGGGVVALSGCSPRLAAPASWTVLAAAILVGPLFGASLDLPQWVRDLSPFTHLPEVPAAGMPVSAAMVTPIAALTVVAAALVATGIVSLRRRDLALPT